MCDKIVDRNIKYYKMNIELAHSFTNICTRNSTNTSISRSFLKTNSGKELTEMICKGYDSIGEALKGNLEGAEATLKEGLKLYSADDLSNIALDTRNFITEVKGIAR